MKEIKSPFWRTIYEYGLITVSIWIMVVGIYFFKFPNHFAFGGITGFSTVVSQLTHWSASDFTSVTNTALLLLGFLFLGKGFGLKTVYATMVMSVSLSLLERFCPLSAPLTSQPLLELMFAIFLPAVGTAILFNIGASSGGTDIIAMILKKYSSMNIGTVLMLVDIASVVASYFIFGVETGLFSTIGLAAKSLVIDDDIAVVGSYNFDCRSTYVDTETMLVVQGKEITKMKNSELSDFRRKKLGFIFQEFNLIDTLNAKDNILLPLAVERMTKEEMEKRVRHVAQLLNIEELLKRYPDEL